MTRPSTVDRRRALFAVAGAGAAAAGFALTRFAVARSEANVVVIGGGPGGATVAGYLKRQAPSLNVTLIEKDPRYTTCFYSNQYIAGLRSYDSITQHYSGLKALGVKVARGTARKIDTKAKTVDFGVTRTAPYDILVVAPGISIRFDAIRDYSSETAKIMPHAWQGGVQSKVLRARLEAMPDGGTVVIAPPKMPYRCPPGPYERACLIAHYIKTKKPKSKLVILDAKFSFSKQKVFEEAFARYYKNIIDLHLSNDIDDYSVSRVDPRTGEVYTPAGLIVKADVANIIPPQTAGEIAKTAELMDGDWCPIRPDSFQARDHEDIYVLGDAAIAQAMPKSAYSAHSQAKLVVEDILARLDTKDSRPFQLRNTCWSMLAPDDSVKIGADYEPGELNDRAQLLPKDAFISQPGEDAEIRAQNYQDSLDWYETLTRDVYPKRAG